MENKNKIGYKVPYDMFDGNIKKGSIYYSTRGNCYSNVKDFNQDYTNPYLLPNEIVETWEPAYEEKLEYKILSLVDKQGNEYNLYSYGYSINLTRFYTLEELLTNEYVKITSVKRLSDNKIFRIGDRLLNLDKSIEYIKTTHDNEIILGYGPLFSSNYTILKVAEHKLVVLKSDDDIDLYEGDKYFEVDLRFDPYTVNENIITTNIIKIDKLKKIFSSKEKALEYINKNILIKNYEILTLSDGINVYSKNLTSYVKNKDKAVFYNLDSLIKTYNITSVKRLSDDEIFTIGDTIMSYDIVNTIEKFELLKTGEFRIKCSNSYLNIDSLKKAEFISIDKSVLLKLMDDCTMWSFNLSQRQRSQISYEKARNEKINEILNKYIKFVKKC